MQLFDLNIPYLESDTSISDKPSKKQTRLKLTVKAMELGYSGIAFNRTIKGLMSESDGCTISPFPLSSLLNLLPSLSSTVSFHRRLLGVSEKSAFRQYSRLTMVVETSSQASALNSGNPVLKSYDLIAVKPLNQNCFDLACKSMQVDLISIDFAEKLPFRLKFPMVKAAVSRGVFFEIMYSSLMQDVQVRRQMISNAKLLVEWTRGKNLIVSSAAPSVLELRGPNDVANLLSLLGLSNECAKAAISKNCSFLLGNALRKKHFYKEAIRVEVMPPGAQTDLKEAWIVDHVNWDPLSSGDGDLLLDDMAKAFADAGKVPQTDKGIKFSSAVDSMLSHGLQENDSGFMVEGKISASDKFTDFISTCKDLEVSKGVEKPKEPASLGSRPLDQQESIVEGSQAQQAVPDSPLASTNFEDLGTYSVISPHRLKNSNALETITSPVRTHDLELRNGVHIHANNVLHDGNMNEVTFENDCLNVGYIASSRKEVFTKSESPNCSDLQTDNLKPASGLLTTDDSVSTDRQLCDQSGLSLSTDTPLGENLPELKEDPVSEKISALHGGNLMDLDSFTERDSRDGLLLGDWQPLDEMDKEEEQKGDHCEVKTDAKKIVVANTLMVVDPLQQKKQGNDLVVAKSILSVSDDKMIECREQMREIGEAHHLSDKNKSGNLKVKRQHVGQVLKFPFKRLLQAQFKKKGKTSMYKTKKRSV